MLKVVTLRRLALSSVLAFILSACTSSSDEVERISDRSPQARYQEAKEAIGTEQYTRAITILSDLETRFPFGPLSRQVQIDLMFAYYKSGQFELALPAIDRFVRLNPNHPQLDYIFYLRGLVNMETGLNAFQDFFGKESADKDLEATRTAFNDFKKLVKTYPESKYVAESRKHMFTLLNKLARREIVVAEYYMRRDAFIAALNRCKYVVEYYQQSTSLKPALTLMAEAYGKLGLKDMKAETLKVLNTQFPKS